MEAVLIDTDVFSYMFKGDSRAGAYAPDIDGRLCCLSFMTAAELEQWALLRKLGPSKLRSLREAVQRTEVLLPDHETIRRWAEISVRRKEAGRPINAADCWIAATALRHSLPLVTHNRDDYEGVDGLTIISHASP